MILVAGGTGRLGTKVVQLLLQRGLEVRVLTRDRTRAAHLLDMGVEIVEGDVGDPAAVRLGQVGQQVVDVPEAVVDVGVDDPDRVRHGPRLLG